MYTLSVDIRTVTLCQTFAGEQLKANHSFLSLSLSNRCFVSGLAVISHLLHIRHSAEANNRTLFCFHPQTTNSKQLTKLHDERVIFKIHVNVSDLQFVMRYRCKCLLVCIALLPSDQ